MFEFEVRLRDGNTTFLYGYNYDDAIRRAKLDGDEIEQLVYQEYID
jgi:hypothetical protein